MFTGKQQAKAKAKGKKMVTLFFVFVSILLGYAGLFGAAVTGKGTPKGKGIPKPVYCKNCGKVIVNPIAIKNGMGALCAKHLPAHRVNMASAPTGYITVGNLARYIKSQRAAGKTNCTISKMVKALGGDAGVNAPANAITVPVYVGNNRYVNPYLGTLAGLQAMYTGKYGKLPNIPGDVLQAYNKVWGLPAPAPAPVPVLTGENK